MHGFTLLELLVVVAIMALATAGVGLALRDSGQSQLEREAERLAALLEAGAPSPAPTACRCAGAPSPAAFVLMACPQKWPDRWLSPATLVLGPSTLVLGPEPLIGRQQVVLSQQRSSPSACCAWAPMACALCRGGSAMKRNATTGTRHRGGLRWSRCWWRWALWPLHSW